MGPEIVLLSATFLITQQAQEEPLKALSTYYKVDKLVEEQTSRLLRLEDRILLGDIAFMSSILIERRAVIHFTF